MIKKNKALFIISCVIILIPAVIGLVLWDSLPESMPFHWNAQGEVDGYASKPVAVLGGPAIFLAAHVLCVAVTGADPKNKSIEGKPVWLVMMLMPVVSLAVGALTIATALENKIDVNVILPLVMGGLFMIIGNYLPKCKQNHTIGIKVPWNLASEENWNRTHRFAGIVWVIGGALVMATSFFGAVYVMLGILLTMAFVPMIYSYVIYKKSDKE